jgi:hypothetical protein
MQQGASAGLQAVRDQGGKAGDVTGGTLDRGKAGVVRCHGRGVADREDLEVAARFGLGEAAHPIGTGEKDRLHAVEVDRR